MKKRLTNNLLLKILSLVIAFSLWFVVINIDDPVDEKSFSNIKINMINTNVLTDQNKVYEVIGDTDIVRVKVEARRSLLDNLSSSDIVAEADFSKVSENDTVEIKFYSLRSNDEINNITGAIDKVKLNIENKKSKRLTLRTETVGEPEEGYIVGTPNMDQNRVEISGPESVISRVVSAQLTVDVSDSTSEISTYANVVLYDMDGKQITDKSIVKNTNSVKVTVPILVTKEVPIIVESMGTPAEGYRATGQMEQSVKSVVIAGEESVVSGINRIVVPATDIDLTGYTQNLVKTYSIKKYLPEDVIVAGDTSKITVTIHVEALKEMAFKVPVGQVHIVGVPEKYTVALDEETDIFVVYLSGLKADFDKIQVSDIQGYIQVDNWMESMEYEELKPGTYTIPVEFDVKGNASQSRDVEATISIKIIEEM